MHSNSHNGVFQRKRWPWILLAGILLLAAVLRLSLKTDLVRHFVKNQIVSLANEQLTVRLSIGRLDGDLWKEAILKNITIGDIDTLASADHVRVSYDIWSYFGSVFEVPEITISKPFLKLRQQKGNWNVSSWLKASPADTIASDPFPFRVTVFQLMEGTVDAHIEGLSKDSAFVADDIHLDSSFGIYENDYEANISEFSFTILHSGLDEPVSFESQMQAGKKTISLQKLVVATGNSVLRSTGQINPEDSTARIKVQAQPLGWQDLAAYVDQTPVKQDLELGLNVQGNASRFQVGLEIQSTGIEQLQLGADFSRDSLITLTNIQLSADKLDLAALLSDAAMPAARNIELRASGRVPIQRYRQGVFKGTFSTGMVQYLPYKLDKITTDFSLLDGKLAAELHTYHKKQKLQSNITITELWASRPLVTVTMRGEDINPGYWSQNSRLEGNLAFKGHLRGEGFSLSKAPWKYHIEVTEGEIFQQPFNRLALSGTINRTKLTNKTLLRLQKNEVKLQADVQNYQARPRFTYQLSTQNFDLSECRDMENFTSAITATIEGEGTGAALEDLRLTSQVRIDSSVVNGESVDTFSADISITDTVAVVEQAVLQSAIAGGSFDARLHLLRWYDPDNELNLDMEIKDIESLAPLAGIEKVSARGTVKGQLTPIYDEKLKFTSEVNLKDMVYDKDFQAQEATGKIEVFVAQHPEYVLNLDLTAPSFSSVQLQDLFLQTRGKVTEKQVDGNFNMEFSGPREGHIIHAGTYRFTSDSSVVTTDNYEIQSSLRTLLLEKPFRVILENKSVRMDTMRLSSDDGAILELAIPYADSTRQQAYLYGKNLNMTVIQNKLLSDSYLEGILSGGVSINNSDSALTAHGDITVAKLNFEGTKLDTLNLGLTIEHTDLHATLKVLDRGDELITGELNVPFRLGNPSDFGDDFFEQSVDGFLRIRKVALSRFSNLLAEAGVLNTQGMLKFNGSLEGKAGHPELTGDFTLDDATISGVKVDSVTAGFNYVHQSSNLSLNASIHSLKQRAAEIKANIPFYMDLRKGDLSLPGKQDSIAVDIETNDFNLASLNDFVDRSRIRNIKGRVNSMVHVMGMVSDLDTKGLLAVTNGSVRVVKAGITIEGIKSTVAFKPDQLMLDNFRAKSGSGFLNINGSVELEKLMPGNINITVKANNFKAANTSEYNAVIDMNGNITGSLTRPQISGSVSILNGFIQLDNFGEKSVENVQLSTSDEEDYAMYDSLSLDLNVAFNRRFFIRNKRYLEIQIELDGSVKMLKEPEKDLQVFGALSTASGYARPLGKRFNLEEGIVTFSGDPTNPRLNIRTLYEPPQPEEQIKIYYIIEGTVEDPRFKYESDPPMELENIISYTLFGQPFYSLDSWKQVVASSGSNTSASDLALEVVMDRVESLATQRLGIDVVKIDNTQVGGESGTSITTGWYINPRVFFAIQNFITGSTPDTGFVLEYMLKKNLKMIISQGNDFRQGVDLKWNFDY